jgi:hypothetical protein
VCHPPRDPRAEASPPVSSSDRGSALFVQMPSVPGDASATATSTYAGTSLMGTMLLSACVNPYWVGPFIIDTSYSGPFVSVTHAISPYVDSPEVVRCVGDVGCAASWRTFRITEVRFLPPINHLL